jgi:rSAM/selenodomain-associated transferase 2
MKLSIIIPVLNEAQTLAGFLGYLQPLRDLGHEVIVVDGGSHDDSPIVALPLCDLLISTDSGRAGQMNAGAERATGDWLLFLHADTRLPEPFTGWLSIISHSDAQWGRFNLTLSGQQWLFRVIEICINWRSRVTQIATGDQALFIRRQQFSTMEGFANIPLMEDIELCSRLRRDFKPLCLLMPVITSSRRWEERGALRTIGLMWSLRWRYFFGADPVRLAKRYQQTSLKPAMPTQLVPPLASEKEDKEV